MIVVTAPTGHIGSQVVEELLRQGEEVRVVVRDPDRLAAHVRERVDVVTGSHRERAVVDAAFEGAESVFWLVPSDPRAESVYDAYVTFSIPAADALVRHGVRRVVTVSALGRGRQLYAGHISGSLAMEDLIRSTGVDFRALAMPSFMDNTLWQVDALRKDGVLSGNLPADQRLPLTATRDIAAVASRLLLDRTWTGQDTLDVLGPEDLSANDMAAILTDVLGTPVRYERGDREEHRKHLVGYGMSEAMAASMIAMDIAKERGLDDGATRTPEGTGPTTFRQWAQDVLRPAFDAR